MHTSPSSLVDTSIPVVIGLCTLFSLPTCEHHIWDEPLILVLRSLICFFGDL